MLADNKLALNAGWDEEILAAELQALLDLDFDVPVLGFSVQEVDVILDDAADRGVEDTADEDDVIPGLPDRPVTVPGDVWQLGLSRLVCGDARDPAAYKALLGDEAVDLIFTDPPYNVPIDGHVCGSGSVKHREFAMGAGEMSRDQFTTFLIATLGPAARACRDGAIAFVCMDWRHIGELIAAGEKVFTELKNVCVWNKKNAGMGTFYRSKHEMIFAFKVGKAAHTNNFGLGDNGRYRTNVWDYAGITSLGATRDSELAMHPTVKPVALVADAIRDCSRRGELVLDVFGGSGTTLIAARKCGRIARLIEFDPAYCDTIIRRFQATSGGQAYLHSSGGTFESVAAERHGPGPGSASIE
jgi:DNA modification methylase